MISAPSEMRWRSMCIACMIGNTIAIVSGIVSATTEPGLKPRLMMLTAMMMAIACQSDSMNSPIAVWTTTGWSETSVASMPSGRLATLCVDRLFHVAAERQNVAAVAHGDGEADRRLAVDAEHRLRRIGIAAPDGRDVAQPDQPAVGQEVDVEEVRFRPEGAGNPERNLLVAGLERACGTDGVLRSAAPRSAPRGRRRGPPAPASRTRRRSARPARRGARSSTRPEPASRRERMSST